MKRRIAQTIATIAQSVATCSQNTISTERSSSSSTLEPKKMTTKTEVAYIGYLLRPRGAGAAGGASAQAACTA